MTVKIDNILAKQEILNTKFHQYFFITLTEDFMNEGEYTLSNDQIINVVIPFEKILDSETDYGLAHLLKYFNKTYSNIIITDANNFNVIHKCEVYQNTLFIKLQPYTTQIALHIIAKVYDATDNILFFKDNFITQKNYQYNVEKTNHYEIYKDDYHKNINLYFQANKRNDEKPIPTIIISAPEVVEINKTFTLYGALNIRDLKTIHWNIPNTEHSGEVQTDINGKFIIEVEDGLNTEDYYTINCTFNEDDRYKSTTNNVTVYVNDVELISDLPTEIDETTIEYIESSYGDRNPKTKPYPMFSQFDSNNIIYYQYDENDEEEAIQYIWHEDVYERTYGEFEFNIQGRNVVNRQNTQINAGYRYNQSSSQNTIHYMGIKDNTNRNPANKCTLIDTNFDNIATNSNVIEQFDLDENDNLIYPKTVSPLNEGFTHESGLHSDNIGKLYHKTIKYFNDDIYVEEFDGEKTKHMYQEWHDEDEDEV